MASKVTAAPDALLLRLTLTPVTSFA